MTLFNISTYNTINKLQNSFDPNDYYAAEFMKEYKVYNFGKLEALVNAGIPQVSTNTIFSEIIKAKSAVETINNKLVENPIYTFPTYASSGYDQDLLASTDANTSCSVLPFNSPNVTKGATANRVSIFSIMEAKNLLSTYGFKGNLAIYEALINLGPSKAHTLYNLINFYEEQILRTAAHTDPNSSENLFTKDYAAKKAIVSSEILLIADYLMTNGDDFIWGSMSPEQKDKLCMALVSQRASEQKTKDKLINYITGFTTLPELENEESRKRALHRFIK